MSIPTPLVIFGILFPCHPYYCNGKGSGGLASKHPVLTPNPNELFAETLLSHVAVKRPYTGNQSSQVLWSCGAIACSPSFNEGKDRITFKSPWSIGDYANGLETQKKNLFTIANKLGAKRFDHGVDNGKNGYHTQESDKWYLFVGRQGNIRLCFSSGDIYAICREFRQYTQCLNELTL